MKLWTFLYKLLLSTKNVYLFSSCLCFLPWTLQNCTKHQFLVPSYTIMTIIQHWISIVPTCAILYRGGAIVTGVLLQGNHQWKAERIKKNVCILTVPHECYFLYLISSARNSGLQVWWVFTRKMWIISVKHAQ